MKTRSGFVSNSSSSSYIVATKDIPEDQIREILKKEVFDIGNHSPLKPLVNSIIEEMLRTLRYKQITKSDLEDNFWLTETVEPLKRKYTRIAQGFADSDSSDMSEQLLVDLDIHYEDNNLYIEKEAGF